MAGPLKRYLFTPGPSPVPPVARAAEGREMIHHNTPEYWEVVDGIRRGLGAVLGTRHEVLLLGATGTGAMEAAVASLVGEGDRVAVVDAGKFGERWSEMCRLRGARVVPVRVEWGLAVDPEGVAAALAQNPGVRALFVTHAETSTGALFDVAGLARVAHGAGALLVVDVIGSLGADEFRFDEWGVDCAVGASQKGLMGPPGLSFAAVGPRAWEAMEGRRPGSYYLDLRLHRSRVSARKHLCTPPVSLARALLASIEAVLAAGLDLHLRRAAALARAVRRGLSALGLELFTRAPLSSALTAVRVPSGMDSTALLHHLHRRYGVTMANGLGQTRGRMVRIGHMGYCGGFDALAAVSALELGLADLGWQGAPLGAGAAGVVEALAGEPDLWGGPSSEPGVAGASAQAPPVDAAPRGSGTPGPARGGGLP
ncbi:MAG: alanine--glyoxylate aminotransferase family protein [Acetobacteraceae bacterium]|nr:alanine--glyoxylate aminotransferase family protein [Acetobacteraceae bacterium]